jgi:acid phosphatase type 7
VLGVIVLAILAASAIAVLLLTDDNGKSGPSTATPRSVGPRIVAAGDISCASSDCAQDTSNLFAGETASIDPAHVLALGDTQYQCGALSKFRTHYDPTWGRSRSITWPAPGNHEYYTDIRYPNEPDCAGHDVGPNAAGGYFSYFGRNANSPAQATCTGGCEGWYFHDLDANGDGRADWRLIALNSGRCGEDPIFTPKCSRGSRQEEWLTEVALKNPPSCILAYWHHPRYTSESLHRDNPATEQFWRDLYAAHADIVLNGHVHNYQRSVPLAPNGGPGRRAADGIVEFVAGTGGAELHQFTARGQHDRRFPARDSADHGALALTLHASGYDWRFVPVSGSHHDHGSASCHSGGG